MRKISKICSKAIVSVVFAFFSLFLFGIDTKNAYCDDNVIESVKKAPEKSIVDNYMSDVGDLVKGFKNYDWQASVGGVVLMTDGDIKAESCTQLLKSKKEYVSINAIYPEVIGLGVAVNLKKIGGDIYFKYINKLDNEARNKLEEEFSWLKWIRIDAGGFLGVSPNDGEFYYGVLFKVIQWEL